MPNSVAFQTSTAGPTAERLHRIETYENSVTVLSSTLTKGFRARAHKHRRGQLIYPRNGHFQVLAEGRVWLGNPQQGVWVSPDTMHQVSAPTDLTVHSVYIDTDRIPDMPGHCRGVDVDALLRELIAHGHALSRHARPLREDENRAMVVLADLIRAAALSEGILLPLSDHPRIRSIMNDLLNAPGDPRSLEDWARENNMSPRTLARLFRTETGMSFGRWRQHLRTIEAISRLGAGESVLGVALDMGYTSQSAFTAMFRRVTQRLPSDFNRKSPACPDDTIRHRLT